MMICRIVRSQEPLSTDFGFEPSIDLEKTLIAGMRVQTAEKLAVIVVLTDG
ncbi:MAG: hypothetical protein JRE88_01540 [Deltaproteobacteria bacterium]|jgi:hypothetical protein|nr:hypothetical protein [Deltaproteobacteria bacterium]MBW2515441.1 hypothetical protein [Deltaproteobacteria bacterium]